MTTRARRILLGSTFVAFALVLLALLAQVRAGAGNQALVPLPLIVVAAVITCVVGGGGMATTPTTPVSARVVWPRALPRPTPPDHVHPYRGTRPAPTAARASARRTALVVAACLAFTAAAVPFALHLPRWIEIEAVLVGWWLVWVLVLTLVARRGAQLADDHEIAIRLPWSATEHSAATTHPRRSWWSTVFDALSCAGEVEGIVLALCLAIVLGVALVSAWFVIELVAPMLFAVAYLGVVHALRRAAEYRGSTMRAGLAATAWATAYVAPLAVVVWAIHVALSGRL